MGHWRLRDIHMHYGRERVLRGVDLTVERGSILGLVGENGSGKSTLLKILAGILRPDRGTLVAAGLRPRVGYMPESSQWYPYLTGAQVLGYFARYSGVPRREQDELLERVGLSGSRDKKVSDYSKGMRQKLGLAQSLLNVPELLVLDEPTNGLDPPSIFNFYEILEERAASGVAVVLSSHILAEIEGRTTHVAFLSTGRVAASGSNSELIERAGLRSHVLLRTVSQPHRVLSRLENGGWPVVVRDAVVDVSLDRDRIAALLAALDSCAEELVDVEVRHPSLADLYLHLLSGTTPANPPLGRNGPPEPRLREVG